MTDEPTENVEFMFNLRNSLAHSIEITLEPWGTVADLPPAVTINMHAKGPAGDEKLEIELTERGVTVWGWSGSLVSGFRDGEEIL